MKKLSPAVVLASLLAANGAALAEDPPAPPASPFTGKVGLFTEYEYRGISQTSEKPALQLNLDYAHASGLYVGTFLSNIKWIKDTGDVIGADTGNANLEWDIYGGYKWEFIKDWTLDVGYLRYEYLNSKAAEPFFVKPNTDEVYAGVSYGPATLKYSYSFNNTFGVPHSKGSDYLELTVNQPIIDKLTFNGTLGHQRYKGHQPSPVDFDNKSFSYSVYKAGLTYDVGHGFAVGGYYKGTNAQGQYWTYKEKDWSNDRFVAFATYSF
jgi:uncharacterized protein (TIGR02001 family)